MESGKNDRVYSNKMRAGRRRTYFFDVRETKGGDYFLTLTESTRRQDGEGFNRHKIFLYKEDFNRFLDNMTDAINHIKTELMPDYDYDEYTRKHEEWEKERKEEQAQQGKEGDSSAAESEVAGSSDTSGSEAIESEDDISW